jgi:cytoskeletal protein RodZ
MIDDFKGKNVEADTDTRVENSKPKQTKRRISSKLLWAVVVFVLIGSVGSAGYFYNKYQDARSNPNELISQRNTEEANRIVDKLKKLIVINESEPPTVARVEDPERLKTSEKDFYKDVQQGDYIVIFPARAILYRESTNQIVSTAPIINTQDIAPPQDETQQNQQQPSNR